MPTARLVPLLALVWLAGCGGKVLASPGTNDAATTPTDARAEPPATCSWSSSFEPLDAAPMRDSCRAARMLVTCKGTDGSGAMCLGYEEKCDINARPGVTYTCANQCKPTEFAATCGTIMGSSVEPPADCPVKLATPGGTLYCCTCSS